MQMGFLNFVVMPLFNVMGELLPISELQRHLEHNKGAMEKECVDTGH